MGRAASRGEWAPRVPEALCGCRTPGRPRRPPAGTGTPRLWMPTEPRMDGGHNSACRPEDPRSSLWDKVTVIMGRSIIMGIADGQHPNADCRRPRALSGPRSGQKGHKTNKKLLNL